MMNTYTTTQPAESPTDQSVSYNEPNRTPPVAKFVYGPVHLAIWEQTDRNGATFHSVRIERRYKDQNGDWRSSNAFGKNALPVLADLVGQAHAKIQELEADAGFPGDRR